jgi:hypothetical protein
MKIGYGWLASAIRVDGANGGDEEIREKGVAAMAGAFEAAIWTSRAGTAVVGLARNGDTFSVEYGEVVGSPVFSVAYVPAGSMAKYRFYMNRSSIADVVANLWKMAEQSNEKAARIMAEDALIQFTDGKDGRR